MMKSIILNNEFINYKINTDIDERIIFSKKVRSKGIGHIPIIIDSIDPNISQILIQRDKRFLKYGIEVVINIESTIIELLQQVKIEIIKRDTNLLVNINSLRLGLENGELLNNNDNLNTIYKNYKDNDDNILYLLLTQEESLYGYLSSIFNYIILKFKQKIY